MRHRGNWGSANTSLTSKQQCFLFKRTQSVSWTLSFIQVRALSTLGPLASSSGSERQSTHRSASSWCILASDLQLFLNKWFRLGIMSWLRELRCQLGSTPIQLFYWFNLWTGSVYIVTRWISGLLRLWWVHCSGFLFLCVATTCTLLGWLSLLVEIRLSKYTSILSLLGRKSLHLLLL